MPTRRYLLQALPIALQALNVNSEVEREGYVTLTRSAHATVARVRARSIHRIADKARSRKPPIAPGISPKHPPSGPGRSGFFLHRAGVMAMLRGLRGWKPVTRVPLTFFSFRPLARPENALLFGLFVALPRS